MTQRAEYYSYKTSSFSCPDCQWNGTGDEAINNFDGSVLDLECPKCFKMLAIVNFPTIGTTLVRGSEEQRKALIRRINFQDRFHRLSLKSVEELPDLIGSSFRFTFRSTTIKGEEVNLIELDEKLIWQEPMVFEGYERFMEIGNILKEKYGSQMIDLVPDETAELFLYGDNLKAPEIIATYRAKLNS